MPRKRLEIDLELDFIQYVQSRGYQAHKLIFASQRGWPDRTIPLPGGRIIFIEFKRENKTGKESRQQRYVRRTYLEPLGHPVLVTDNLGEAKQFFEKHLRLALDDTEYFKTWQ